MKPGRVLLILVTLCSLRCATIVKGRHQTIAVDSNPQGAAIAVDCGGSRGVSVTPVKIRVSRRVETCRITLTKDGFQPRTVDFQRRVNRAFWSNLYWIPGLSIAGYLGGEDECAGFLCTTRREDAVGFAVLGIIPAGIGMLVDRVTGSMYEHRPVKVNVDLVSEK